MFPLKSAYPAVYIYFIRREFCDGHSSVKETSCSQKKYLIFLFIMVSIDPLIRTSNMIWMRRKSANTNSSNFTAMELKVFRGAELLQCRHERSKLFSDYGTVKVLKINFPQYSDNQKFSVLPADA